jgi:AraC-like DNA-binding protein
VSGDAEPHDVRSLAVTLRHGAVLEAHRHRWGQLVFATSGVLCVVTESMSWLVPPTKAIWLPGGVTHRIRVQGEAAMRTLYLADSRAGRLPRAPLALAVSPLLREVILHILGLGMLDPGVPQHDRLAGVLVDLLCQARQEDLALPMPRDRRALAVAAALQDRPEGARDLPRLAAASGASLRTLQRIFPRETGLTIEAWRQKARLIHAVASLTAGASVTQAALDCGYRSASAFVTAFTRHFGVTPGRYFQEQYWGRCAIPPKPPVIYLDEAQ